MCVASIKMQPALTQEKGIGRGARCRGGYLARRGGCGGQDNSQWNWPKLLETRVFSGHGAVSEKGTERSASFLGFGKRVSSG